MDTLPKRGLVQVPKFHTPGPRQQGQLSPIFPQALLVPFSTWRNIRVKRVLLGTLPKCGPVPALKSYHPKPRKRGATIAFFPQPRFFYAFTLHFFCTTFFAPTVPPQLAGKWYVGVIWGFKLVPIGAILGAGSTSGGPRTTCLPTGFHSRPFTSSMGPLKSALEAPFFQSGGPGTKKQGPEGGLGKGIKKCRF